MLANPQSACGSVVLPGCTRLNDWGCEHRRKSTRADPDGALVNTKRHAFTFLELDRQSLPAYLGHIAVRQIYTTAGPLSEEHTSRTAQIS